jgi:hypothetical protein
MPAVLRHSHPIFFVCETAIEHTLLASSYNKSENSPHSQSYCYYLAVSLSFYPHPVSIFVVVTASLSNYINSLAVKNAYLILPC